MGEREQEGSYINSPIAKRLRAKTKKPAPRRREVRGSKKLNGVGGHSRSEIIGKAGKAKRTFTATYTLPTTTTTIHPSPPPPNPNITPIKEGAMEDLYKNLNELHSNTEKSMKEMVDSCKTEINGNLNEKVNSLTESMKSIKSEMTRIESVFEEKLTGIEGSVKAIETRVENTNAEIKKVENAAVENHKELKKKIHSLEIELENSQGKNREEIKCLRTEFQEAICTEIKKVESEANETQKDLLLKIKHLETELANNREKSRDEINSLKTELEKTTQEHKSSIEEHTQQTSAVIKNSENEINELKTLVYANAENIKQSDEKLENLENRVTSGNLLIEGLPENDSMDLKTQIGNMIRTVIPAHKDADIRQCYRIGKKTGKKKRPRSIMATLVNPDNRDNIIAQAKHIKKVQGYSHVWINRDQTEGSRRKHSLAKACYNRMQECGYSCTLKGSTILYDGHTYDYEKLSLLPEKCKPEDVKSLTTDEGKGLAFHSEHVYCSNFSPCIMYYEGQLFTSAEHVYQVTKVKAIGYPRLAEAMMMMVNPYYLKKLGDSIDPTDEWKDKEEVMEKIIRAKFQQSSYHRGKLERDTHTGFFEMTSDRKWATGVRLTNKTKSISEKDLTGRNIVGQILSKIKKEICGVEPTESTDTSDPSS